MPIDDAVKTQAPPRRFASAKDIEEFVSVLEAYERGVIGPDEFRTFRLTRGIYGQRQDDVQMIRVKIPQGILSGDQLRRLGRVAREHSRGFGHVTTRQNVQFHFVKMAAVPKAMEALEAVGLTTREACGNTVRNITACPMAGVCADEPFDVTPYGEALTRFFLRNPICQALPRKFKIALSGCPTDCAMGAMHDIGIIARTREVDGRREIGFKVVIGGGLSVSPQNAWVLHEFLPPERLLSVCEAIVRVFDRNGNRKNKGQARMKYAIRKLGFETFEAIAGIAENWCNGAVRTAQDQNILLRWVKSEELPAVHRALQAVGLGQGEAGRLLDPTSCPGAESCKIAVTGSRELALAVKSSLSASAGNGDGHLVEAASDLRIKISGCPNSCGQHHVAGIGFHGAARNANGRAVPAYQMFLGGSVDGDGAHFGRRSAKIPARRVPEALTRLLALFRDERLPGESALAFYKRVDLERVNTVLADLTACSEADLRDDDFKDIGSDRPFEMEVGEGECAT